MIFHPLNDDAGSLADFDPFWEAIKWRAVHYKHVPKRRICEAFDVCNAMKVESELQAGKGFSIHRPD